MDYKIIEIKAKCKDQNKIRDILKSRNAKFIGLDHQIDTYFNTSFGKLKLREGNIENCLAYYKRENKKGPKQSDVITLELKPDSPLKLILKKSLGILVMVDKKREIYFIGNVKFHLDKVKKLGNFVEIEAIDHKEKIGKEKLLKQCKFFLGLFGIPKNDLISVSYSDLLLKK